MRIDGKIVRDLRLRRSWSQETLAENAGVNRRTIQRIESTGIVSLRTRNLIASTLGVEPTELDLQAPKQTARHEENQRSLVMPATALGLYVIAAIVLFAFVVLDQLYFYLLEQELVVVGSTQLLSEVADFLLQFTGIAILIAFAATILIWQVKRARLLLLASASVGLIVPIAATVLLSAFGPDIWTFLDETGIGAIIRFALHGVAAALAIWSWLDFRSMRFVEAEIY